MSLQPRKSGLVVALILLGLGTLFEVARAQISPGPLARPHAELDGSTRCTSCHTRTEDTMDPNCLSCHGEIQQRLDAGAGFHAKQTGQECATCHPDHAGREFELIFWGKRGRDAFDHAQTDWPLTGKHGELECRTCHKAEFQKSDIVPLIRKRPPGESWLGLGTACADCHRDPHAGSLGVDCASCHATTDWKDVAEPGEFPHERTAFPLRGLHARVPCASCHDPETAWGRKPAFARCADCHVDPHAGTATLAGLAVDCASCHDERGFVPSTFNTARHQETNFPLVGGHRGVACASCHAPPGADMAAFGKAGVNLHPDSGTCAACHGQPHGTQLANRPGSADCTSCHTGDVWKPSTFDVARHAALPFPLEGAHASTECAACHGPGRVDLPPLPGKDVTGSAGVLFALRADACGDCHRDPHAGRYKADGGGPTLECTACHGEDRFRPSRVDVAMHEEFSYPLRGAHRATPCFACHGELQGKPALGTLLLAKASLEPLALEATSTRCADCHENPHGTQFTDGPAARDCASCHDESVFRPAVRFDHEAEGLFPLKGGHEGVPCAACHRSEPDGSGNAVVQYRSVTRVCSDCHGGSMR